MTDRKARVGQTHTFVWESSDALSGAPTLTLDGTPYVLTALRAAVEVTAVAEDLCILTADDIDVDGSKGAAGRYGKAFLVTEDSGVFPVRVAQVGDGTVTLAAPLPREFAGGAMLQWATWYTQLPAGVTAAEVRDLRYDVAFEILQGDDIFAEPGQVETGLFHVVDTPFATGLTHEALLEVFPELRDKQPRGRQDLGPVLGFAEQMLVARLRTLLAPRGLTEDDLKAAQSLRPAHAHLAASVLLSSDPARAGVLQARAHELAEEALRAAGWLDEDQDGVVDDGESAAAVTGPARTLPLAWSVGTATRQFTWDRVH
jgi:hypothetical protein